MNMSAMYSHLKSSFSTPIIAGVLYFLLAFGFRSTFAHNGRGFEIEVVAGKLQAQGVNAGVPDGAPAVRPYLNSIHDHWEYIPQLNASTSSFPEFEVLPSVANEFLESYALHTELQAAWQWKSPPLMPREGTIPQLVSLDPEDTISVQTLGAPITTDSPGTVEISPAVPAGGTGDVVPLYQISGSPSEKIHILQFVLTATPPTQNSPFIESSDPIFVILSPDGSTPAERLHHASLYIEKYLALEGVPVPEPSSGVLAFIVLIHAAQMRNTNRKGRSRDASYTVT